MATFRGLDLFSSGPHRVRINLAGRLYLPPLVGINTSSSTLDVTTAELQIEQSGRLAAPDEATLWQRVQAIVDTAEGVQPGTLLLDSGQQWTNLRMLRFGTPDPPDRGREFSIAYTIEYRRLGP